MEILFPPDPAASRPVLVIHSWWGPTKSFHNFGHSLAKSGFTVGLADLFNGKTANTPADAMRLRRAPRREPMYKNLVKGIEQLHAAAGEQTSVAVVSFSMGGHWAVWLSQQQELPIRSTVLYYAARAGNFGHSRSSFLAHFAEQDDFVSIDAKRKMAREIGKAGRPFVSFDYSETEHWFAENDRTEAYDATAAELALERSIKHLVKTM